MLQLLRIAKLACILARQGEAWAEERWAHKRRASSLRPRKCSRLARQKLFAAFLFACVRHRRFWQFACKSAVFSRRKISTSSPLASWKDEKLSKEKCRYMGRCPKPHALFKKKRGKNFSTGCMRASLQIPICAIRSKPRLHNESVVFFADILLQTPSSCVILIRITIRYGFLPMVMINPTQRGVYNVRVQDRNKMRAGWLYAR